MSYILLFGGFLIALTSSFKAYRGVHKGIVEGMATLHWPSTQGASYQSGVSSARLWWWPRHQRLLQPYYYQVNEIAYSGSRVDVRGPFVGSESEIDRHLIEYSWRELSVYYNPANPKQSVLKPGIAFDHMTKLYLAFDAVGLVLFLVGVAGFVWYRSRSSSDREHGTKTSSNHAT